VDLDVEAEGRLEPDHEELDLLRLSERGGARQAGFEALLIVDDRAGPHAGRQLAQQIGLERGAEAQV
jgi:hypothetical protein